MSSSPAECSVPAESAVRPALVQGMRAFTEQGGEGSSSDRTIRGAVPAVPENTDEREVGAGAGRPGAAVTSLVQLGGGR